MSILQSILKLFRKKTPEEFDEWYLEFVDPLPLGITCPETQPTFPGALETLTKDI